MSQANQDSPKAFNLHTKGIGYFNRIRQVTPGKGQPFWSVEVNCLHGNDGESTRFDCKVVGQRPLTCLINIWLRWGKMTRLLPVW